MKNKSYFDNRRNKINELRRLGEGFQFREFLFRCEIFWMATDDPKVLPLIAQAHALLGDKQQADTIVQGVIEKEEICDNANCLVDIAAVFIFLNQVETAIKCLQKALTIVPEHSLAKVRLGFSYLLKDDMPTAKKVFVSSIGARVKYPLLYDGLIYSFLCQSENGQHQTIVTHILEWFAHDDRSAYDFSFANG